MNNDIQSGDVRLDNDGKPYLSEKPASTIVHIAYQHFSALDIGVKYTTLFATEERQMVNGINNLFGTNFTWGRLDSKTHDFFNPVSKDPFIRLRFSNVGEFYVAQVVVDDNLQIEGAKPSTEIGEMLLKEGRPKYDTAYFASRENVSVLTSFMHTNFSTRHMSFNPSRDIDSAFLALAEDAFLTPVVLQNYRNNGGYSTLLFKNEVLPAIELDVKVYSRERVAIALGAKLGIKLSEKNFTQYDMIHVFDPYKGVNEEYTIFKLTRGDDVKYMAAVTAVEVNVKPVDPVEPEEPTVPTEPVEPELKQPEWSIVGVDVSNGPEAMFDPDAYTMYKKAAHVESDNPTLSTVGEQLSGWVSTAYLALEPGETVRVTFTDIKPADGFFLHAKPTTGISVFNDTRELYYPYSIFTTGEDDVLAQENYFTIYGSTFSVYFHLGDGRQKMEFEYVPAEGEHIEVDYTRTDKGVTVDVNGIHEYTFATENNVIAIPLLSGEYANQIGGTLSFESRYITDPNDKLVNPDWEEALPRIDLSQITNNDTPGEWRVEVASAEERESEYDNIIASVLIAINEGSEQNVTLEDLIIYPGSLNKWYITPSAENGGGGKVINSMVVVVDVVIPATPIDPDAPIVKPKVDLSQITNGDEAGIWNVELASFDDLATEQENIVNDILGAINLKTDRGVVADDLVVSVGDDHRLTITATDKPITKVEGTLVVVVTETVVEVPEPLPQVNLSQITNHDVPGEWYVEVASEEERESEYDNIIANVLTAINTGSEQNVTLEDLVIYTDSSNNTFIASVTEDDAGKVIGTLVVKIKVVIQEEPSSYGPTGLKADYPGTGWYKATDTGTVFSKDVPELETMVFEEGGLEYVSVYTSEDARNYGERAATSNVTDMRWALANVNSVGDITTWDVSNVTTMYYMFSNFWSFNQDISNWDVSNVTSMGSMFSGVNQFNRDISGWDVSNVTNMDSMFRQNAKMNQDLSGWCVPNITSEPLDFSLDNTVWTLPKPVWGTCPRGEDGSVPETPEEPVEYGPTGLKADYSGTGWYKATDTGTVFSKDVPALETMVFEDGGLEYVSVYTTEDAVTYGARAATSNLTEMGIMFESNLTFNEDIGSWDVSNVTNMHRMFSNAISFNQDISMWDVSSVTNVNSMFYKTTSFNQDLSSWNVSNVTDMGSMFERETAFNQDISSWDVSNVTNMSSMFSNALAFNQDISNWDVSNVTDINYMFYNATSFNQDLSGWCVSLIPTKPAGFDSYTNAWTLPQPVWGTCPRGEDGSTPVVPEEPVEYGPTGLKADYPGTGWYKATDTGTVFCKDVPELETMVFETDGLEYVSVYNQVDAKSYGARAATSNVTNMASAFYDATSFNEDISSWDVSSVTNMDSMFYGASMFNSDISSWDVSNVVAMGNMFGNCTSFNQDISSWDVSNVTLMTSMFGWCHLFNQDISSWDVSSVTNMAYMFFDATAFNQDLSQWCVSNISSKPTYFETDSALIPEQLPVWGTCPRGENAL